MFEADIVVRSIGGEMLFTGAVISFKSVIVFINSNISLHVFIENKG